MGKRYRKNSEIVDSEKKYDVDMAFDILSKFQTAKFDETVNVAVRLGIDPQQADQMVRGAVVLPHGVGKKVRILVFAKGEKEKEGRHAGADYVGSDDLIEKISKENWLDFDKVIATPDMMGTVSKLGKILGPRGLMPNPKLGTVTFEIARAVEDHKKGKVEYRNEKGGIVHTVIGKFSFGTEKLKENFMALMDALIHAKPASSKGTFIRSVTISLTHGPGMRIEPLSLQRAVEA